MDDEQQREAVKKVIEQHREAMQKIIADARKYRNDCRKAVNSINDDVMRKHLAKQHGFILGEDGKYE